MTVNKHIITTLALTFAFTMAFAASPALAANGLELTKLADSSVVAGGEEVTFTVVAENTTNSTLKGVEVADLVDGRFTLVSQAGTDVIAQTSIFADGKLVLEWNLGDIGVGETKTLTYTVRAPLLDTSATLTNSVDTAALDGSTLTDPEDIVIGDGETANVTVQASAATGGPQLPSTGMGTSSMLALLLGALGVGIVTTRKWNAGSARL